ncbi:SpaH/EbpB family LPXTG-anchored major pilin [Agrococcus terreus]|uniref:SpaH/EbpB family LPXTG-anchored major pilin n=1 Tax=Agrococcus terreus TaxID=574649 RepID=UPI0038503126
MNTTIRRKGSRLIAGFVAAGIGVAAALGMASPAMAAPDESNIDPNATGSIVVHKHATPNPEGTTRSTGTELSTPPAAPLQGVQFTVSRVTHATALDLTKSSTWQTLSTLSVQTVTTAGNGYSVAQVGTPQTTDAQGVATFGNLPVGVYLVQETSAGSQPIALRSQPFLVSIPLPEAGKWNYNVHVYPKNSLTGILLAQDTTAARALGDVIKYTATTDVPNKQDKNPVTSYVITDTIDATQVTFKDAAVRIVDGTTTTNLVGGTGADRDYDLVTNASTGVVTVTLTPTGVQKVNNAGNGAKVVLDVNATVTALGDGSIENTATVRINDLATVAAIPVLSHWGGANVVKYPAGAGNENLRLNGAVFEVYTVGGTTPIAFGTGAPRQTQFTTGAAGVEGEIRIPALAVGTYELREVTAPTGYRPITARMAFEVTKPVGATASVTTVGVPNEQVQAFELPITGGDGQMAFMIGGGALLIIAAGAFLIVAGRRAEQQG